MKILSLYIFSLISLLYTFLAFAQPDTTDGPEMPTSLQWSRRYMDRYYFDHIFPIILELKYDDRMSFTPDSAGIEKKESLFQLSLSKNYEWALKREVRNLLDRADRGLDFFKAMKKAHNLIEKGANSQQSWALEFKVDGLSEGRYGYLKNENLAKQLFLEGVERRQEWALKSLVYGLSNARAGIPLSERLGLPVDEEKAHSLIEDGVARNENWAFEMKHFGQ